MLIIYGYCEECHKTKRVRVSGKNLTRYSSGVSNMPVGICSSCEAN